jgi:hypothetical protein
VYHIDDVLKAHVQETLSNPIAWEGCDAITFSVVFILAFSIVTRPPPHSAP